MSIAHHILNLGAGVQSSVLYLGVAYGKFDIPIDYAIFADVGEEPQAVYQHLAWMQTLNGPPILVRSRGKLGDDLTRGINSTGQRFASIPAFTAPDGATRATGMTRRQCTREYKIDVIDQTIRRDILKLKRYQHRPANVSIVQYYGISSDEAGRAARIVKRCEGKPWLSIRFPLIEMSMSRTDCLRWLDEHGKAPHVVPRSSCVFCPYHKDDEWIWLRDNDPQGWARAVEIDEALRRPGNIVNRGLNQKLYLHRKVKPLTQIEFQPSVIELGVEVLECEGMCGL